MMGDADQGKKQIAEEAKQAPKKKPAAASNQCFIGEGNNASLAKETLAGLGFRVMPRGMLFSNEYRFKWTQTSMEVNYMHFKEGVHIANHISNANKVFTNKIATLETVANLQLNLQNGQVKTDMYKSVREFAPETYRLDVVSNLYQFLNSSTGGLWLEKKSQSNQGRGIRLISDVAKYREELLIKKDVDTFGPTDGQQPADSTEILLQKLEKMEKEGVEVSGSEGAAKEEAKPE